MLLARFYNKVVMIAVVATAVFLGSSKHLLAQLTLPNLPAGSKYQIIFATSLETAGGSSSISGYNTLAADSAALDSMLPGGVTWSAVASTLTVAASANAPSASNIPIYNTHGTEVSAGNLYSGSLLAPVSFDENGGPPPISLIWTGATAAGGISANPLGSTTPEFGESTLSTSGWITGFSQGQTPWPIYALSSPITVVPEPGTLALLAFGAVLATTFHRLHKKRFKI